MEPKCHQWVWVELWMSGAQMLAMGVGQAMGGSEVCEMGFWTRKMETQESEVPLMT